MQRGIGSSSPGCQRHGLGAVPLALKWCRRPGSCGGIRSRLHRRFLRLKEGVNRALRKARDGLQVAVASAERPAPRRFFWCTAYVNEPNESDFGLCPEIGPADLGIVAIALGAVVVLARACVVGERARVWESYGTARALRVATVAPLDESSGESPAPPPTSTSAPMRDCSANGYRPGSMCTEAARAQR